MAASSLCTDSSLSLMRRLFFTRAGRTARTSLCKAFCRRQRRPSVGQRAWRRRRPHVAHCEPSAIGLSADPPAALPLCGRCREHARCLSASRSRRQVCREPSVPKARVAFEISRHTRTLPKDKISTTMRRCPTFRFDSDYATLARFARLLAIAIFIACAPRLSGSESQCPSHDGHRSTTPARSHLAGSEHAQTRRTLVL